MKLKIFVITTKKITINYLNNKGEKIMKKLWQSPYERLEKEIIQKFETYNLYQVFGIKGTERIPLYRECENREVKKNRVI